MTLENLGIYGGLGQLGANKISKVESGLLPNLISYWPFNETSGNAVDLHGGYTLTAVNSPSFDSGKVYSYARKLVKTSSQFFYRAHGPENIIANKDFTIAYWIKKNLTEYMEVVTYLNAAIANGYFSIADANFYNRLSYFKGNDLSSQSSGKSNDWALFVCGYDSVEQKIFASTNGAIKTKSGIAPKITVDTAHQFRVGRRGLGGDNYFTGLIGPVCFWKSDPGNGGALTQELITKLYNSGAGLPYSSF